MKLEQHNGFQPGIRNVARRHRVGSDTSPHSVAKVPDPEVSAKATRRRFSAKYKMRILQEADACTPGTGELGALLRREGLYASNLYTWRRQRDEGALTGLRPKKRGRKPVTPNPLAAKVAKLERDNARLQQRLSQAETIIAVQKKVSELLGLGSQDGRNGGKA